MAVPFVAAAAARGAAAARTAGRAARSRVAAHFQKPPHVLDIEGIFMLLLAILFDVVNILLGILDLILIGLVLSPIWNAIALGTLGAWLWFRTGQGVRSPSASGKNLKFLAKRIALPFIGNSVPIAKFFPWWVWSVWSSLDKGAAPQTEEEQEQEETPPQQEQ